MPRSYSADQIITLPRVDTTDAITLGAELLTAARAESQPSSRVARALKRLTTTYSALSEVASHPSTASTRVELKRETDRLLDGAWGALFDWLSGWSKLPYEPAAADQARHMSGALFPDGLKFTLLPFKREWSESETRIRLMEREGFAEAITKLGGAPFVKALRKAHKAYGEVLGITRVPSDAPSPPALREPLEAFILALRGYVLQVTAHADEDDPGAHALTERLLSPLARWQTRARGQVTPSAPEDTAGSGEGFEPKPDAGGDEAPKLGGSDENPG